MGRGFFLTIFILASAAGVHADLIPFLCGTDPAGACGIVPGVVQIDENIWEYNYLVELTAGEQVTNAGFSYVTIYDIPGYIPGSAEVESTNTSFGASESLLGRTPAGPFCCSGGPDSASLFNVTWTSLIDSGSPAESYFYVGFAFESTIGPGLASGFYSNQAYRANSTLFDQNSGPVLMPGATPEPPSMALIGIGLIAVLPVVRRLRAGRGC